MRKLKLNANYKINNLTWEWFVNSRIKNVPIFAPIIQCKARQIAKKL